MDAELDPAGVERGDPVLFEGLDDLVVVDAHGPESLEHLPGVVVVSADRVLGDLAMVGDRAQGVFGHGVDHAGGDQVDYVAGVGVGRVLDPSGGPQGTLGTGPSGRE